MPLSTTDDRQYFTWSPPAGGTIFTVTYGIDTTVTNDSPFVLYRNTSDGSTAQLLNGTHYTIQNITTSQFEVYWYAQAAIDYPDVGTCMVWRNTPQTQLVDYVDGDKFPVSNLEKSLDKLTMIVQDMQDQMNLSIIAPKEDMYDVGNVPIALQELPNKTDRAEKFIYFDTDGQPTAVTAVDVSVFTPTAFGISLMQSSDAAAGRLVMDSAKTDGDINQTFNVDEPTSSTHATTKSYVDSSISTLSELNRNYLDNGQFLVAQRGSGPFNASSSEFTVDRWRKYYKGSTIQTVNQVTSPAPPSGPNIPSPRYSLQWFNTGSTGLGAGEWTGIEQDIEAITLTPIQNSKMTVGFWVYCNQTVGGSDKLCVTLCNDNLLNAYTFVHEYEITAADTWEYKTFTVDFTGIPLVFTEGTPGLKFHFSMGAIGGTGVNDTWVNILASATPNQLDCTTIDGFTIYFTNVTFVMGDGVLPADGTFYPLATLEQEYTRCYRYLYLCNYRGVARLIVTNNWMLAGIHFPQYMCKTPTISVTNPTTLTLYRWNATTTTDTVIIGTIAGGTDATRNRASIVLERSAGDTSSGEATVMDMTAPIEFNADITFL